MIRVESLNVRFGPVHALRDASLEVQRGEWVALLGPSGCGKTTLLRSLAGFERPDAGRVEIDGREMAGPAAWVAPEHRRVGTVFQDYALFPHLDVAGNVGFGLPRRERSARADELLALVGLGGLGGRYPDELSGGQRQRVALARALAPRPEVVLLDEPWNAIDPLARAAMRNEVARILRDADVTALIVTHDREEAFTLADRIAVMRDGEVVQTGRAEELYFAPADRWAAEFIGPANIVSGEVARARLALRLDRDACEVLVRPELIELQPDETAPDEVVERTFLGHDVLYRVRLADGTTLISQRPSSERVPVGARVRLRMHDGPVPVLG
ncbi:MAG: ABC transporter ATP-binding protein [Actinomycetota bacterium]|nr:ABC transporter ATP-binding protein [Actinomycetota bacterium]